MKKVLSLEQCWNLSSYLHSAARSFEQFEKQAAESPAIGPLAEQFAKQKKEANELADLFANASSVTIVTEEE